MDGKTSGKKDHIWELKLVFSINPRDVSAKINQIIDSSWDCLGFFGKVASKHLKVPLAGEIAIGSYELSPDRGVSYVSFPPPVLAEVVQVASVSCDNEGNFIKIG